MRARSVVVGAGLCVLGCGGGPDETTLATTTASWARTVALTTSQWSRRDVPTKFAAQVARRASDELQQLHEQAAALPDTGHATEIRRAIDTVRATLPPLDSALAHSHRDSVAPAVARLERVATSLVGPIPVDTAP